MSTRPEAVVLDLGGVLVDWNPRHLYREYFKGDEAAMEAFLANVCTMAWNEEQDAGRSWAEGVRLLKAQHPDWADLIERFDTEWEKTLKGAIPESVEILRELKATRIPLYGLSNWSAEKFPHARRRFEFLSWFDGLVISGEVGMKKPDPRIFEHLLKAYGLTASKTLFVDDSMRNIEVAKKLGFVAVHFGSPAQLRAELVERGLLASLS